MLMLNYYTMQTQNYIPANSDIIDTMGLWWHEKRGKKYVCIGFVINHELKN